MVGIIQEQHPDRAALFMQWKGMDWPILVDSLNLLEVRVVPLTYLIDEHGVIRYQKPSDEDLERFLSTDYQAPPQRQQRELYAEDFVEQRFLWGDAEDLDSAIAALADGVKQHPEDGWSRFRLGVALRKRYDSPSRRDDDFQRAVEAWTEALALDPNQYIWRRRIQQYGPRLDKPYPFYDWVPEARVAIETRGEMPLPLIVEPGGAEFAAPSDDFESNTPSVAEPDPDGKVYRDQPPLIEMETVVVPSKLDPGDAARVHVVFRPDQARKAHWNNEVDDLVFWIRPPDGWRVDQQQHRVAVPRQAVSQETRYLEFELRSPDDFRGSASVDAYALYYVCEDVDGTCLYRRRDVTIELRSR